MLCYYIISSQLQAFKTNAQYSAVADMGDRLATIDMGRKLGDVSLFGGSWVLI